MKPALPLILTAALALPVLSGCTAAVIGGTAAGVATIHDRRTTGTVVEDQNIKLRVRNLLSDNPEIKKRSNISVTSYNQRVLLYGQTEDAALADKFAQKVSRLPKVNAVYNEVIEGARTDAWDYSRDTTLVAKIKTSLFKVDIEDFDPTRVKVAVSDGNVYLMGLVTRTEGPAVVEQVRGVTGVKKVVEIFEYLD
ncbi:MAG: BON domain-containing protein [Gammaproteobacteria bacterium]|jgi:osmotically-inducible protein OsmY